MSLNSLIAYAILVLSLGVSTSFGQCPPLSEGKLPGSGMITHIITPVQQIVIARPQVPASFLVPVDLTRRPSIVANTGVLSSVMTSAITRRPNFATGSNVGFQGPVSIQVPGAGIATKIVEQDGRFIIVGASDTLFGLNNEQGLFLARFNADGTPDQTFGQGGSTRIILFAQNNMANNESPSVTLSPEGKIIVARTIIDMFPGNQPGSCVAVVRFDHDGSLDPNFGTGGFVYTTIKDQFKAFAVAVQPDDKVLVAGSSGHIGECLKEPCTMLATLVRYESNGQLDPGFGGTGVVRTTWFVGSPVILSTISSFSTLFVQENGLIAAAGTIQTGIFQASTGELIAPTQMLIAEYLPTGELNPVFGSSGATTLSFGGPFQTFNATSLTVRENGNILAGGSANLYAGNPYQATLVDQAFIFARAYPRWSTGRLIWQCREGPGKYQSAGRSRAFASPRSVV
jgi:uncharacterized delta-60 repeat protein